MEQPPYPTNPLSMVALPAEYAASTMKNICQALKVAKAIEQHLPETKIQLTVAKNFHPLLKAFGAEQLATWYEELLDQAGGNHRRITDKFASQFRDQQLIAGGKKKEPSQPADGCSKGKSSGSKAVQKAEQPKQLTDVIDILNAMQQSGIVTQGITSRQQANLLVATLYAIGVQPGKINAVVNTLMGVNPPTVSKPFRAAVQMAALRLIQATTEQQPQLADREYDEDMEEQQAQLLLPYPGYTPPSLRKRPAAAAEQPIAKRQRVQEPAKETTPEREESPDPDDVAAMTGADMVGTQLDFDAFVDEPAGNEQAQAPELPQEQQPSGSGSDSDNSYQSSSSSDGEQETKAQHYKEFILSHVRTEEEKAFNAYKRFLKGIDAISTQQQWMRWLNEGFTVKQLRRLCVWFNCKGLKDVKKGDRVGYLDCLVNMWGKDN